MKILPKKWMRVTEELRLPVSQHYFYTTFGVRGHYDTTYKSGQYVMTCSPGTGFFARESEGHSYRDYVYDQKQHNRTSWLRMVLGLEPDYDKAMLACEKALKQETNPMRRKVLESYQGCLGVAKDENLVERKVRAIKDRMGHHPNKYLVSVMSRLKSKTVSLEHDMQAVQLDVRSFCKEGQFDRYVEVIKAFIRLAESRRIWMVAGNGSRHRVKPVYWDLGIFNFIQCPFDTPLMRDINGIQYFIMPDAIVKVKSGWDFEAFPLKDLSITCAMLPEEGLDEISIPEMDLLFHLHHKRAVPEFVGLLNDYKRQFCE